MISKRHKKQRQKFLLNDIQLIAYDFDGVLTDNKVILREDGIESVIVNRSDGLATSIIKSLGIKQIIITTELNKVVEASHKEWRFLDS
jgi:3-deoxy-D-manno-octulosonate 8-phosphate phosphatase KdsC-like HAD superfamily phosphatase